MSLCCDLLRLTSSLTKEDLASEPASPSPLKGVGLLPTFHFLDSSLGGEA